MNERLGIVLRLVATSALGACGGSAEPGTLRADGTTTSAEREDYETECEEGEQSRFDIDPALTCASLEQLLATKRCEGLCGHSRAECWFANRQGDEKVFVDCANAPVQLICRWREDYTCAMEGRRPDGLCPIEVDANASVGDYFANASHLEAASVVAFARLAAEIEGHGAPRALVAAALRAAEEERRHVVITSDLAIAFGSRPIAAAVEPMRERSLVEIARENLVEGVVRETFGAAVALYRAARARDAEVRAALAEIATDECRHAELSWALHAWLCTRLSLAERAALERVREEAIAELGVQVRAEPAAELVELAGVPSAFHAEHLHRSLVEQVWTELAA